MSDFRMLVLCVGNIHRSPMTERLLVARLAERGVAEQVSVASAGVGAVVGSPMHPTTRAGLETLGGSADGFVARQVNDPMLHEADLVLTATRAVRVRVLEDVPGAVRRTFTILEYADLVSDITAATPAELVARCADAHVASRHGAGTDAHEVPDPVGADEEVFAHVAGLLDGATTRIADALAATLR